MKKLLYNLLIYSSLVLSVSARAWTSQDGSKTFEAEYRSYNKTTGKVVVDKGIRQMTFNVDILSEADKNWLKQRVAKSLNKKEVKNDPGIINVTKNLHGTLYKLKGKKLRRYKLKSDPEYYIIYYSASW